MINQYISGILIQILYKKKNSNMIYFLSYYIPILVYCILILNIKIYWVPIIHFDLLLSFVLNDIFHKQIFDIFRIKMVKCFWPYLKAFLITLTYVLKIFHWINGGISDLAEKVAFASYREKQLKFDFNKFWQLFLTVSLKTEFRVHMKKILYL